ncbi:hypothetical protein MKEN_00986600 [Mycena kentingensis (nom. inval.)]|nr:hypothetical protein MKEN_00986600 [Mycena kentingensis (nom. inval.)]
MARAPFLSAFILLFIATGISSAPVKRQTGNLECNLARLAIINDVAGAQDIIAQVQSGNSTDIDLPTAAALAVAQTALTSANDAFQTIRDAVLVNEQAPPEARDQVDAGLTAAITALGSISTNSTAGADLAAAIAAATDKVVKAGKDGNDVVALCK